MASLLDKLRQQQSNTPATVASLGATEDAAKLLAARSGKATTQPMVPISDEAEKIAAGENQAAQQQVAQAGRLAAAQTGVQQEGQAKELAQAQDRIALQYQDMDSDKQQKLLNIDQQARHAADKLGLDREQLAAEARLAQRRLSDQKYVDQLNSDHALKNAFSSRDRREELVKLQFNGDMTNLMNSLGMQSLLMADQREWNEKMSRLDLQSKWKLFMIAAKAAEKRATVDAIKGGTQAGMGMKSPGSGAASSGGATSSSPAVSTSSQYDYDVGTIK